jgi:hypothetical protein
MNRREAIIALGGAVVVLGVSAVNTRWTEPAPPSPPITSLKKKPFVMPSTPTVFVDFGKHLELVAEGTRSPDMTEAILAASLEFKVLGEKRFHILHAEHWKMIQEDPTLREFSEPKPQSRGLGDTIAKFTSALGIKPCDGCKGRQATLNKWFPYS